MKNLIFAALLFSSFSANASIVPLYYADHFPGIFLGGGLCNETSCTAFVDEQFHLYNATGEDLEYHQNNELESVFLEGISVYSRNMSQGILFRSDRDYENVTLEWDTNDLYKGTLEFGNLVINLIDNPSGSISGLFIKRGSLTQKFNVFANSTSSFAKLKFIYTETPIPPAMLLFFPAVAGLLYMRRRKA